MSRLEFGPFWEKKLLSFFRRVNFAKDGKLSKNDFETLADRYVKLGRLDGVAAKQVRRKIVKIWADFFATAAPNGVIDEQTFLKTMKKNEDILLRTFWQFCGLWFDAIDLNGDGVIQAAEFLLYLRAFGVDDEHAAEQAFKMMDTQRNGQLSYDEFVQAGCEYFISSDESLPSKHMFGPLI
jgi:Ca2+-binding EF-hand superfamily protein